MTKSILPSSEPARFWDAKHNRAVRNVAVLRDQVLADFNLSSAEWFVLDVAHAARDTTISVGQIAGVIDVQTTYIALILRRLQAKNFIRSEPSKQDRRVHLVTLTADGRNLLKKSEAALTQAFAGWTNAVSPQDYRGYANTIDKLAISTPEL
jgi:DNA-binding MarR family transcriptional regulator